MAVDFSDGGDGFADFFLEFGDLLVGRGQSDLGGKFRVEIDVEVAVDVADADGVEFHFQSLGQLPNGGRCDPGQCERVRHERGCRFWGRVR